MMGLRLRKAEAPSTSLVLHLQTDPLPTAIFRPLEESTSSVRNNCTGDTSSGTPLSQSDYE